MFFGSNVILPLKWLIKGIPLLILLGSQMAYGQLMSAYTQKTGKLTTLESKIKGQKEEIKSTLKAMHHSKNVENQKDLFNTAVENHKALKKSIDEYNALRREVKYKFPRKNEQTSRRYLPMREVSLEEIENEIGIDGIMNRVKSKMDKKYKTFTLAEDKSEKDAKKKKKKNNETEERLRLEK